MRIVITGGSGFIGRYLIKRISNYFPEFEIVNIDKSNGKDILDKNSLNAVEYFDCMVHLAAKSFVPTSFSNPEAFYTTNVLGTLNALELCRRNNAKMIYVSSYVYGEPKYIPIDEEHPLIAFNPYGQSKLLAEQLCTGYHRDFEIPLIILRPFNIYGYGQGDDFLIPSIFSQIKSKKKTIYLKDSTPRRDFIYVEDLVEALVQAIINTSISFGIYNVCSGKSYSISEVSEMIKKVTKIQDLKFVFDNTEIRKNEVSDTKGKNKKIRKALGWKEKYNLYSGLEELAEIYNNKND